MTKAHGGEPKRDRVACFLPPDIFGALVDAARVRGVSVESEAERRITFTFECGDSVSEIYDTIVEIRGRVEAIQSQEAEPGPASGRSR